MTASGAGGCYLRSRPNTPEQELAVEVGHVNGVHVDHIDLAKAAQRQVLEQLAAQAARPNAQHAHLCSSAKA